MIQNLLSLDNFINESNELLKAQDACKGAMFQIQKPFEKFLDKCKKANIVESYKTKIKPWNSGYMMEYHIQYPEGIWRKENSGTPIELIYNYLSIHTSIFVQPCAFFEDYIEEEIAYIEGQALPELKGRSYNACKFMIKTKDDIKKSLKEYVDINLKVIEEVSKVIE